MSRRPHPYFSRINRLDEARKLVPGTGKASSPDVSPDGEPGILWQEFRAPE